MRSSNYATVSPMLKDYGPIGLTLLGFLLVFVQYRCTLRNTRIRLAKALKVEIKSLHETQREQLCTTPQSKVVDKAEKGEEPFLVWYGRSSYPIFDNAGSDLWLLPEDCVCALIRFYERDGLLRGNVSAAGSPNFTQLSSAKRIAHVNEIFDELHGKYIAAKEEAIEHLSLVSSKKLRPW
jgi:hypothetical protein